MPLRKTKVEDPVSILARCIDLTDGLRAYRRKDTEQIDAVFSGLKGTRFRDHYDQWIKARPAAEKIVDMPAEVPGVKKLIQNLGWLKVANRVFLMFLVVFIAVQIVPAWREALGPNALGGDGFLYATILVMLAVISMNIATYMDFRIRKKIIAYEAQTMDEFLHTREQMKEFVNKMLKSLAKEAKRAGGDRNAFSIILYFDDYDNIEVVKQWRPKSMGFFRKSYSHYQIIPKL